MSPARLHHRHLLQQKSSPYNIQTVLCNDEGRTLLSSRVAGSDSELMILAGPLCLPMPQCLLSVSRRFGLDHRIRKGYLSVHNSNTVLTLNILLFVFGRLCKASRVAHPDKLQVQTGENVC